MNVRRALARAAVVAVVLEALYVAGAAVYLATDRLSAAIASGQDDVEVRYRRAWSLWPGRVTVKDLEIIGHDTHVEWLLAIDEATTWIDLADLARLHFRAHDASVDGVVFRIRKTRDAEALCSPERASLPSIPGRFNPPAVVHLESDAACRALARSLPEKPQGPPSGPEKIWHVDLARMDVHAVHEIWIEESRFVGEASVSGDFAIWPTQELALDRARVDISAGALHVGGHRVLEALRGEGEAHIDRFSIKDHDSSELPRAVSLALRLGGDIASVGFLNFYLQQARWLHLGGGEGPLALDVAVEHGVVSMGSKLEVKSKNIVASGLGQVARGSARVVWDVVEDAGRPLGRLGIAFADFSSKKRGEEAPHLVGHGLTIDLFTRDLDLVAPFSDVRAHVRIQNAVMPDLSRYNQFLPDGSGLAIESGTATAGVDLSVHAGGRARGVLELATQKAVVRYRDLMLGGRVRVRTQLDGDFDRGVFDVSGTRALIDRVRVGGIDGWWGRVELRDATLSPGKDPVLATTIATHFRDARPLLAIATGRKRLPGFVENALSLDDATATARLEIGRERAAFHDVLIRGDGLKVQADLGFDAAATRGAILLSAGGLALEIELDNGDSRLNFINPTTAYFRRVESVRRESASSARTGRSG